MRGRALRRDEATITSRDEARLHYVVPDIGRIDVHAHLLPGVDDGCQTLEDALLCARRLVSRGYTHCFCTPHVWSNLPHNNPLVIAQRTRELQLALEREGVPLALLPGGEINLRPDIASIDSRDLVSYAMRGRHALIDLWADRLPAYVEPAIRWLQALGLTVILAHPERMRAVQDDPSLGDRFAEMGVLLQGNLQCFSDPPHALTRIVAERFLREGRYFAVGTDLHGAHTLDSRMNGLERVRSLVDAQTFDQLTIDHPRELIEGVLR